MPTQDFLNAITTRKPVKVYRIAAEIPNTSPAQVGLTAWYTAGTIAEVKAELISKGYKVLKVEESQSE